MKAEETEKKLSLKQYLYKIIPYLRDMIYDHKAAKKVWKIQISLRVNFISSKHTGDTRTIYVWSDNKKIIVG